MLAGFPGSDFNCLLGRMPKIWNPGLKGDLQKDRKQMKCQKNLGIVHRGSLHRFGIKRNGVRLSYMSPNRFLTTPPEKHQKTLCLPRSWEKHCVTRAPTSMKHTYWYKMLMRDCPWNRFPVSVGGRIADANCSHLLSSIRRLSLCYSFLDPLGQSRFRVAGSLFNGMYSR